MNAPGSKRRRRRRRSPAATGRGGIVPGAWRREAPRNPYDLIDRHLQRATSDDLTMQRYRMLIDDLSSLVLLIVVLVLVFVTGVVVAALAAGLSVPLAATIGVGGTGLTYASAYGVARLRARRRRLRMATAADARSLPAWEGAPGAAGGGGRPPAG